MELTIEVTTADDTFTVTTTPWVIMLWERRYKAKVSNLGNGVGAEDLVYMAYEGAKMAGHTVPINFETFAQSVRAITVVDGDSARPTPAAPSAG